MLPALALGPISGGLGSGELADMTKKATQDRYVVQTVVHASRILGLFESDAKAFGLREVSARTGFSRNMCFRLLYTLRFCGFLEKRGDNRYRLLRAARGVESIEGRAQHVSRFRPEGRWPSAKVKPH
jgi:hypothetical protein